MPHSTHGTVVLMGSGEMGASMVEVHKYAMRLIEGPLRAAFIDTPAGFQLNADLLAERAVEYFTERLNMPLEHVRFKDSTQATREQMQTAVNALHAATYIFAGPGSPTYAIRNWKGTPIYDAMFETLTRGGCLTFASAAALTLGRWTIPVYEVYKVGGPPHWVDGLNTLGHFGLDVAVVPHWNNRSGGDHDTNYCFMGAPRWETLYAQLPASAVVLGIDEHTACILRVDANVCEVRGVGQVRVLRGGDERVCSDGDTFPLDLLRADGPAGSISPPEKSAGSPTPTWEAIHARHEAILAADPPDREDVAAYIYDLLALFDAARSDGDWRTLRQAEEALREALVDILARLDAAPTNVDVLIGPYVDLLLRLRAGLRDEKQYALADRVRDGLSELGVTVEDRPDGSSDWHLNET
jgi:cyanophycinase-like exopeptidase